MKTPTLTPFFLSPRHFFLVTETYGEKTHSVARNQGQGRFHGYGGSFEKKRMKINETGVLPTSKNVDENEKYVGKGYPDVSNGVGKNVERKASGEDFPKPC
ncbi:hypothetical protein E6C27_scaffold280G003290 [Cucumis melo var. makuwa]|nr:hypothetical protein E6C27_scaffold280G003290 [Cucumis melo var. makuwa]